MFTVQPCGEVSKSKSSNAKAPVRFQRGTFRLISDICDTIDSGHVSLGVICKSCFTGFLLSNRFLLASSCWQTASVVVSAPGYIRYFVSVANQLGQWLLCSASYGDMQVLWFCSSTRSHRAFSFIRPPSWNSSNAFTLCWT